MKVRCRLVLEYDDERIAEIVYKSVKVDDKDFVKSSLNGRRIIARTEAISINSLLHTLNDYLACISTAEKITNLESERKSQGND